MRKMLAMLACVCLLAGWAPAAELVDNPAYQNWAKYKPGSSITHTHELLMGDKNSTLEMTRTLKEITPEKAVVEIVMKNSMMRGGGGPARALDIAAKVQADWVETGKMPQGMKGEAKSLGKAKVKVGDKEYECEVTEFTGNRQTMMYERNGITYEGKSWTSDQVPESMIKMEMKAIGIQSGAIEEKMTLKSVEIK